jgi:hypothetical protein
MTLHAQTEYLKEHYPTGEKKVALMKTIEDQGSIIAFVNI